MGPALPSEVTQSTTIHIKFVSYLPSSHGMLMACVGSANLSCQGGLTAGNVYGTPLQDMS